MLIIKSYTLGMLGTCFILWNTKHVITLESKNLQHAIKEANEILKQTK